MLVPMAMMQIRIMGMAVDHGRVPMPVRMRLAWRRVRTMRVLVVLIMVMAVLVLHRVVRMIMFVPLGHLVGRLMTYDSLKMKFRELRLRRAPDCPVCGPKPTITSYIDYEGFCAIG